MNANQRTTVSDWDPDEAPDLSRDGWPEKFAKAAVRRGPARVSREGNDDDPALTGRSSSTSGQVDPDGRAESMPRSGNG